MIRIKTQEEIEILRENAIIVSKTLAEVGKHIAPGVTTMELDRIAEQFIRDNGAEPGFLGYGGFPYTLCVSVNDVVVHGFPSDYRLKDGDIVSVDCGTIYKESLYRGIEKAIAGNRVGDIGHAVQSYAESFGFSVVREFVGHGVGKNMHEHPEIPNYGRIGSGKKLINGMTICIEPMINAGQRSIYLHDNGWAVSTVDKKYSAHFELTVAVKDNQPDVLSTFDFIEGKRQY